MRLRIHRERKAHVLGQVSEVRPDDWLAAIAEVVLFLSEKRDFTSVERHLFGRQCNLLEPKNDAFDEGHDSADESPAFVRSGSTLELIMRGGYVGIKGLPKMEERLGVVPRARRDQEGGQRLRGTCTLVTLHHEHSVLRRKYDVP